uniref:Uncharacterized protein n=1 Tax=Arion vulgaris TaxID=1028688 RepID=A0A0B7AEW0_9EUPU
MSFSLNNKVAIVTGSSSGIGESIAILFASKGARVTLCGRDQERLKSVFNKAVEVSGGHQDRFLIFQGDINDQKFRKETISKTVEKFGRLDILVANAGVGGTNQSLLTATEDSYNFIMDTNLKSVFFLIQQAVPHLEKSKGNIINISSIVTDMALADVPIYSMSKVALDHLTRCLAVDLGAKGIRVNAINPGYIETRIMRYHGDLETIVSDISKVEITKQVLKHRLGTGEDVAEVAAFLASDSTSFITGENIRVDGGRIFGGPIDWSVLKPSA